MIAFSDTKRRLEKQLKIIQNSLRFLRIAEPPSFSFVKNNEDISGGEPGEILVRPEGKEAELANELADRRIAIVATDGFEQVELTEPKKALEGAGAKVDVIAPHAGSIQGMRHHDKGDMIAVTRAIGEARPQDYDALVLPGGVVNPDALRVDPKVVAFVRGFFDAKKPVAAICHGPWTLIEADMVRGRRMTSWPSLKTDLRNAGADWVDQEVVRDGDLVTSRKPDDLPAFCREMIRLFQTGADRPRHAAE